MNNDLCLGRPTVCVTGVQIYAVGNTRSECRALRNYFDVNRVVCDNSFKLFRILQPRGVRYLGKELDRGIPLILRPTHKMLQETQRECRLAILIQLLLNLIDLEQSRRFAKDLQLDFATGNGLSKEILSVYDDSRLLARLVIRSIRTQCDAELWQDVALHVNRTG